MRTHGEHSAWWPNGCQTNFRELIFDSALCEINLHKLATHHFLKQIHTHTHGHMLLGRGGCGGGCSVPTVRSPSPNKNSTATASVWCERLREPGMRRCSVDSRSEETRLEIFNLYLDKGKPSEKTKANSEHTCYTWSQVHIQYIIYSHVCCTYQSLPVKLAPQRQWCTWTFVRVRTFM